ncbi:MAG: NepR family anti-sigma factor [Allosphingosinicella sp.]
MNFENETDRRRKSEPRPATQSEETSPSKKKRGHTPEVGHALRAAYQQTVNEDIPPEMLDLLGKLG